MLELLLPLCLTSWDTVGMVTTASLQAWAAQCPDTCSQAREEALKEAVLREVGARGFFEATFETTTVDTTRLLRLVPGRRYTIERIVVDGAASVASGARERLEHLAGTPWDASVLQKCLEALLRAHEEGGYPFASLGVRHYAADSASAAVFLRIGVTPGPRTIIEGVEVPDTIRTRPRVAARLGRIVPGSLFRISVVEAAVERLRKTGYFAVVGQPTLSRGSSPFGVVVRIPLAERPTHRLRGALGLDRAGSPVGSLQTTLRNIAGTAREASLAWEARGQGRTDLHLWYREPWIMGLAPSLDLEVRQAVEDTLWVEREGSAAVTWDLGAGFVGTLGYRGRRVIPGAGSPLASLRSDEAWGQAVWDGSSVGVPPRGHVVKLSSGYRTLRDLDCGLEIPIVRLELEARRTFDLSRRMCLETGIVVKAAVHGGDDLPLPELFRVGGARSVRGYREAQFRTDGAAWATIALHYGSGGSTIFLFADGGAYRILNRFEGILGIGPGIMAQSTRGTVEFAYGVPWGSNLFGGRIHLSLGREF